MRLLLPLICWAAVLGTSAANPVVVISDRRPTTMTAEGVVVTVSPNVSNVSGDFSFRQDADFWPEERDNHVFVFIPVLLRLGEEKEYLHRHGAPVVSVGGKKFICDDHYDLAQANVPFEAKLPKGWEMKVYSAQVPLNLVGKTFTIKVNYAQPNFTGQRAGYVPLLPPEDPARSRITFRPADGYSLRPPGFVSIFAPNQQELSYHPKDRQLLTAKLVKR